MSSDHTTSSNDSEDTNISSTSDVLEQPDENTQVASTPPRIHRPRLEFLCPSTKVEDVGLEVQEGRALENRRILTLILDDTEDSNAFHGTYGGVSVAETGALTQLPYKNYANPAFWLLANRWVFLPKSKSQKCPTGVKVKLEEDIAYLKDEEVKVFTDEALFEARESMMEWAVRKAGSDE
ncbi:uncharacterized protein MELLADRAFT_107527 [Melampsora larici-populina 98AG31]|uniref:Uncharacterized protein n=1 Tax=Melampsora larici-populina (strain 98AG31 / pathotype 3-4-7) TaxID=747676 RepID=F4RQJ9_MELLP|nr:uncharacterized protein MELLADRAFT_107527 [Melampsora larici-populina 98AG31]EGG05311.1 hypothetical protein MELLADRAFT_107527 [Melampsora larici-populina 98AG31]